MNDKLVGVCIHMDGPMSHSRGNVSVCVCVCVCVCMNSHNMRGLS